MLYIPPKRSIGFIFKDGPSDDAHDDRSRDHVFSQIMLLQNVARLVTCAELDKMKDTPGGGIAERQQMQRLSLEFFMFLVGTGVVHCRTNELRHRMRLQVTCLEGRLRDIRQTVQLQGGMAYLREVWSEDNVFSRGVDEVAGSLAAETAPPAHQPFTLLNIARGLTIFDYIESLKLANCSIKAGQELMLRLWADIQSAYGPILGESPADIQRTFRSTPADMEDLFLRYFTIAKCDAVVKALMDILMKGLDRRDVS